MTVSTPFSAPAWPPETGASMKPKPLSLAAASSSRATSAEAVVWSTKMAPLRHALRRRRPAPSVDLAQVVVVADAGEDDLLALGGLARASRRRAPPCSDTQSSALAAVRL